MRPAEEEDAPTSSAENAPVIFPEGVLSIRPGHGANCSSVGSVVDLLFAASGGGGALLVAVTAALAAREESAADEPARASGDPAEGDDDAGPG